MITTRYKASVNRVFDPIAGVFVRLGVSPTAMTLGGLALVCASCAVLVATRNLLLFCTLATIATVFDALDGSVARQTGRVTKFGAYLDAMCDRYAELAIGLALGIVTGYWMLVTLVLGGSFLISYAKARAAMEVSVSNTEWPDLMERTERGIAMLIGIVASEVLGWQPLGRDLLWWTMAIVAALVHATALQRLLRARSLIVARESASR